VSDHVRGRSIRGEQLPAVGDGGSFVPALAILRGSLWQHEHGGHVNLNGSTHAGVPAEYFAEKWWHVVLPPRGVPSSYVGPHDTVGTARPPDIHFIVQRHMQRSYAHGHGHLVDV
jgi:hypothetical protein